MGKDKQALEKEIKGIIKEYLYCLRCSQRSGDSGLLQGDTNAAHAIVRLVEAQIIDWQQEVLSLNHAGLELEKQLADKDTTIGVLEATIETWKDIEAGHLAKTTQMVDRIAKAKTGGWLIDTQQADTAHYRTVRLNQINGIIDKALSTAPRVVWQGKGKVINYLAYDEHELGEYNETWIHVAGARFPIGIDKGESGRPVTVTVTLDEGGEDG